MMKGVNQKNNMKSTIYLPKTINVGYQKRDDTYTGKLAYIIYKDEKGVLRKAASWNSWRDQNIDSNEFDNTPTEGFVLNKHAGGVENSWGWNARKSYCRVYDPRGFEFEISIENLLYILENCSCIPGKGIEGKFVYGWDKTDLVLIPCNSPDYKEIEKYSDTIENSEKIRVKDLKLGATYMKRNGDKFVYLGKYDYFEDKRIVTGQKDSKRYSFFKEMIDIYHYENENQGKKFYFCKEDDAKSFEIFSSISGKFVKCTDENPIHDYAERMDILESTNVHYSPIDKTKEKRNNYTLDEFIDFLNCDDQNYQRKFFYVNLNKKDQQEYDELYPGNYTSNMWIRNNYEKIYIYSDDNTITRESIIYIAFKEKEKMTVEELWKLKNPIKIEIYLKNGKLYEKVG